MNIIDTIKNQIKVLMGTETKVEFASAKLSDGTEFQYDGELAEGVEVFTLDEAGEKVPMADGEYALEDGTKFLVKDGKYALPAVEEEAPVEEAAQEEAPMEDPKEDAPAEEAGPDMEARLAALEEAMKQLLEHLATSQAMSKEKRKPTAEAIKQSKVETSKEGAIDAKAEMEKIRGSYNKY